VAQAIHDAGYVYRDLKPQNVLLTAEGTVLISDMGLAHDTTKGPIKQCSGTRGYWSPETIAKAPYTTQPDWWSLGVTMCARSPQQL
jgi:serine/threonine protein kinase